MPGPHLLGVDVGGTKMKGAVFDLQGRQVAFTSAEYPILHNEPLAAEHDPANWLWIFKRMIRRLIRDSKCSPKSIEGVSVDCLCPTLIPVNKHGKALMNSI